MCRVVVILFAFWAAVSFTVLADPPEKILVPSEAEIANATKRVQAVFKSDYAKAEKSLAARQVLVDLLTKQVNEEKEPATLYALLTESRSQSAKLGDLPAVLQVCAEMRRRFDLGEVCPGGLASVKQALQSKTVKDDRLAVLLASELAFPTDAKGRIELGDGWADAADKEKGEARLPMQRRALSWLSKGLATPEGPKGLDRVQVERRVQSLTEVVDAADAKTGRWTVFEGKWEVTYENGFKQTFSIDAQGEVAISPNDYQGQLVRRKDGVWMDFTKATIKERMKPSGSDFTVFRIEQNSGKQIISAGVARRLE